jgi:transposase
MTMLAYRYALDPAPAQERALWSHAGAARVAFNWGLGRVKANLSQREAERSYGIGEADLTPGISWSLYSLRKDWNAAKDAVAPWWAQCSKEAFNTGLGQLARALKNWGDSRKGKRKGELAGFPRFRSKRKARPSVRFTTGAIRCEGTHAVLPRLGRIKLHERTRTGDARILSATVRHERGRWFASFTVEQDIARPAAARPDVAVGVDLVRNRRLARHVADASFAEIRRQLACKMQWHGGRLIVADRWFASSRTCSKCGAVKAKLALSERTYCCTACGTVLDRDVNAAVNLAKLAGSGPDSNGRGGTVRPGPAGRDPVKRQPGARQRDKTGTAAPQGTAAA